MNTTWSTAIGIQHEEQQNLREKQKEDDAKEGVCDRRLSRAARFILRKHLSKLLRAVVPPNKNQRKDNNNKNAAIKEDDEETVWDLLHRVLPKTAGNNNNFASCLLHPSLDRFKADEEHVAMVSPQINLKAYPSSIVKARHKESPQRPQFWYQSTYSGKVFATRFYLDWHMDRCDQPDGHPLSDNGCVDCYCPATTWCQALGGESACHEVALQLEPYYDRGSGGWGDDRSYVQHKMDKKAHSIPCDKDTIEQSRQACHALFESCGWNREDDSSTEVSPLSGRVVHTHICEALACPNRIFHHMLGGLHPEAWMDEWHLEWSRQTLIQHELGIVGILIVFGLLVWYLPFIWKGLGGETGWSRLVDVGDRDRRRPNASGRRLLQKSSSTAGSRRQASGLSSLSPWKTRPTTSYADPSQKRAVGKAD
jgi:hypothetical protein